MVLLLRSGYYGGEMESEPDESRLAEEAAKAEQKALEAESRATRFKHLLGVLASSATVAVMAGLLSASVMDLVRKIYGDKPVITHELSDDSFARLTISLERSSALIVQLESGLANSPQELATVIALKAELQEAQKALKSSSEIKNAEAPAFSLNPFGTAYAQDATAAKPTEENDYMRYVLFGLIALVAFVLVAFCLMYMYTSDKTKKAFAEKTITTIIGFIFGLITGQMSAKAK